MVVVAEQQAARSSSGQEQPRRSHAAAEQRRATLPCPCIARLVHRRPPSAASAALVVVVVVVAAQRLRPDPPPPVTRRRSTFGRFIRRFSSLRSSRKNAPRLQGPPPAAVCEGADDFCIPCSCSAAFMAHLVKRAKLVSAREVSFLQARSSPPFIALTTTFWRPSAVPRFCVDHFHPPRRCRMHPRRLSKVCRAQGLV